jgi:hypothetical protein
MYLSYIVAFSFIEFNLQLPVQSVPITTKVVSLNPVHGKVYSIQHYVIMFVSNLRHVSGFVNGEVVGCVLLPKNKIK